MQVNRNKSSVKGYKTLLLIVKQLKSKSNTYKQHQINYKMIQNSAFNKFLVNIVVRTSFLVIVVVRNIVSNYDYC